MRWAFVIVMLAWLIGPWPLYGEEQRVQVKGYYRKDGTYVAPHTRRMPQRRADADQKAGQSPGYRSQVSPTVPANPLARPPIGNFSARTNVLSKPPAPTMAVNLRPNTTTLPTNTVLSRPPLPPSAPQRAATNKVLINAALIPWLQEQAQAGSVSAQRDLGQHYLDGEGVPKNETLARSWLTKAARQGDYLAYEKLKGTDYPEEKRDANGRLLQSTSARKQFRQKTGYPQGRPSYVIDHLVPIEQGGSDTPENMQWVPYKSALDREKWD